MNERTLSIETTDKIDQEVTLKGWVHSYRQHGKVIFIDLRDRTGLVQVVFSDDVLAAAEQIRPEYVIEVRGKIIRRSDKYINEKIATGTIEVQAVSLTVLAKSETSPLPLDTDGYEIDDEVRMKFRYLDLRRERLNRIFKFRSRAANFVRHYLVSQDFIEIETPCLSKATPEGARDFLVPSRLQPGSFYALPQSPQQYKQLLMVAGFERYMQLPKCFRDEDPRADRAYGEFTQVDLELSFTTQDEILGIVEDMMIKLIKNLLPHKKIQSEPFPRIKYDDAMQKYQSDRPDLREDKNDPDLLAFAWVVDFPAFEYKEGDERWGAMHHPFTAPATEDIEKIRNGNLKEVKAQQYDLVLNGWEVGGGSIRITDPEIQSLIFETLGHSKEDIEVKFGHLLEAFKYGVPPHGGLALGFDRLVATFMNEDSVREVIAFPSTGGGVTAVMNAPTEVEAEILNDLHIEIKK